VGGGKDEVSREKKRGASFWGRVIGQIETGDCRNEKKKHQLLGCT